MARKGETGHRNHSLGNHHELHDTHITHFGLACTMVAGVAAHRARRPSALINRSIGTDGCRLHVESDAHNNASTEEWIGHVEVSLPRGGAAHAGQFFMVNSNRSKVKCGHEQHVATQRGLELLEVHRLSFRLQPDENWGWSGDEGWKQYGGAEAFAELPACRMNLRGLLAYAELASTTSFPLKAKGIPTFGSSFGRNRGSMGSPSLATADDLSRSCCAVTSSWNAGVRPCARTPPGEYVLQVECGLRKVPSALVVRFLAVA